MEESTYYVCECEEENRKNGRKEENKGVLGGFIWRTLNPSLYVEILLER